MTAMLIRRLGAADVDDYRAIRLRALRDEPDAFGSTHATEAAWPRTRFAERLATSTVLGAYLDGRIVGMAGFKPQSGERDRHKGFVWGVYVDPVARRRRVALRLMTALMESAAQVVEHLVLTVVEGQPAALALYRKLGFSVYGLEPRALKGKTGYSREILMIRVPDATDASGPDDAGLKTYRGPGTIGFD